MEARLQDVGGPLPGQVKGIGGSLEILVLEEVLSQAAGIHPPLILLSGHTLNLIGLVGN